MDPVTLIGFIASLTEVTIDVFVNLKKFYHFIRERSTQSKELPEELDSLVDMLTEVREILCKPHAIKFQKSLQKELENLYIMLDDLRRRTAPKSTNPVIRGLQWPFRQAENADIISKIKVFKSTLNKILSMQQL
jgi:hypothetical protein